MSSGSNKDGLFVDTGFLRDHVSKLNEEKKIALRLYETVAAAKNLCDPTIAYQYDAILRDVEDLIAYFAKMADALAYTEDEAIQLSHELARIIEDGTDEARNTISNTIVL